MKALYSVMLSLVVLTAQAEDDNQSSEQEMLGVFAEALALGVCSVVEQPMPDSIKDEASADPLVANKELHGCQYISEALASGCSQDHSCTSYETWTGMNPSISPRLPRQVFLQNLSTRQAELKSIGLSTLALK